MISSLSEVILQIQKNISAFSKIVSTSLGLFEDNALRKHKQIEEIRRKILRSKDKALNMVERCFDETIAQINRALTTAMQALEDQREELQDLVERLEDDLHMASSHIKTNNKCLKTVITYFTQRKANVWQEQVLEIDSIVSGSKSPLRFRPVIDTAVLSNVLRGLEDYIRLEINTPSQFQTSSRLDSQLSRHSDQQIKDFQSVASGDTQRLVHHEQIDASEEKESKKEVRSKRGSSELKVTWGLVGQSPKMKTSRDTSECTSGQSVRREKIIWRQ